MIIWPTICKKRNLHEKIQIILILSSLHVLKTSETRYRCYFTAKSLQHRVALLFCGIYIFDERRLLLCFGKFLFSRLLINNIRYPHRTVTSNTTLKIYMLIRIYCYVPNFFRAPFFLLFSISFSFFLIFFLPFPSSWFCFLLSCTHCTMPYRFHW